MDAGDYSRDERRFLSGKSVSRIAEGDPFGTSKKVGLFYLLSVSDSFFYVYSFLSSFYVGFFSSFFLSVSFSFSFYFSYFLPCPVILVNCKQYKMSMMTIKCLLIIVKFISLN